MGGGPSGEASSQPPAYVVRTVPEGFTLMSTMEQGWCESVRGRFIPNFEKIRLWLIIKGCLSNLGWEIFHEQGTGYTLGVITECATTMCLGSDDEGDEVIAFRVMDEDFAIKVELLTALLGFDEEAPVYGNVNKEELEAFGFTSPTWKSARGAYQEPHNIVSTLVDRRSHHQEDQLQQRQRRGLAVALQCHCESAQVQPPPNDGGELVPPTEQ